MVEHIPDKKRGRGRPPLPKPSPVEMDWDALYLEYMHYNGRKCNFLRSKGLDPNDPLVKQKTDQWNQHTKAARTKLAEYDRYYKTSGKPRKDEATELWEIVQAWRKDQCKLDYETANVLRQHIRLILNNSVKQVVDPETKKATTISKLKPQHIKQMASALIDIQKIQRLALGLSTENVGVEADVKYSEEKIEIKETIFEVQVNHDGKFIKARPELVKN